MQEYAGKVLRFVGGAGLFFSFTEVGQQSRELFFFPNVGSESVFLPPDLWSVAGPPLQEHQGPSVQPRSLPLGTSALPPLHLTFLQPSNAHLIFW